MGAGFELDGDSFHSSGARAFRKGALVCYGRLLETIGTYQAPVWAEPRGARNHVTQGSRGLSDAHSERFDLPGTNVCVFSFVC